VLPAAALAAVVGRTAPLELARRTVHPPPLRVRLRAALAACVGKGPWTGPLQALTGWRAALAPPLQPLPRDIHLPSGPFVAVLLQPVDDERLRLDADAPPDPVTLVTAAQRAAGALDRSLPVVAVLPPRGLPARAMATLRRLQGVHLELANAAVETCVAATVVVTVNDPVAGVALLAGTPVAHLGRALYGIPGVATKASVESLAGDLRQAVEDDLGDLRKRFLSWMLAHGHVWCCVDHPDHNGINGLVLAIEQRLAVRSEPGRELNYRVGPAWPLTAEGR
jgi:hypothetical protein